MSKSLHQVNYFQRAFLIIGGVVMLFPFFWMISSSLKNDVEAFATPPTIFPSSPNLDNYRAVAQYLDLKQLFINSMSISLIVTFMQLLTSSMAGYAFARIQFKGKSIIFMAYLVTMMIPMQVVVVPLFIEMRELKLIA